MVLAGTDNDYSITQNGTANQFEVYFNGATGQRIACDIGTFNNCLSVPAGGGTGTMPFTGSTAGFEAIPGILHAYKTSAGDLATFTAAVPEPETYAMLMAGLAVVGAVSRRRKIVG